MRILCFTAFLLVSVSAAAVKISGKNIQYAGKELIFYRLNDPISKSSTALLSVKFDDAGFFQNELEINKPALVFCEFGIYKGLLILEPGKDLEIIFPPVREKSFADQKNPFFNPVSFWFNTGQKTTNTDISAFEIKYNQITDKYFNELYFRQSKNHLDSVKNVLNSAFPETNSPLFETYRNLKFYLLETDVCRHKPENIAYVLNDINPDFWELPAFTDFLEKLFNNRLSLDSRDVKGDELKKMVANNNLSGLQNYIALKYKLNSSASDLVLLKFLYDAFYSGEFPKTQILEMIQAKTFTQNNNKNIQQFSRSVYEKLNHLLPGTKAPEICLKTLNENTFCTSHTKNKFKYLVFADVEMLVCQEQLKHLQKIDDQFNKHLEIVVIYRNTGLNEIIRFVNNNIIPGVHVFDEQNIYISKYRVKTFPLCFLLNENHEVVFAETRNPVEGFSQQFGRFLQQELFNRQRNQPR